MKKIWVFMVVILGLSACGPKEYAKMGDNQIVVFDNEHLFSPEEFDGAIEVKNDEVYRIVDGRILMKKIKLPVYEREVKANVKITVASAGDRWDKSGSCFVISASSDIDFMAIHNELAQLPDPVHGMESLKGIVSSPGYLPAVELMRFMTPFGIGFYNDKMDNRKPVYVPLWEDKVQWEQDVTDRLSLLEGEVWIGVWIDTWTKEGYTVSMELNFEESPYSFAAKTNTQVKPLVNTVYYAGGQTHADIFARQNIELIANVPQGAKNVRLKYITTGHGGHSGGDEFVKKRNVVKVDGEAVIDFVPWRDDCASFRRFNPGSGVWLIEDTAQYIDFKSWEYREKVIEERLASSDLSRSNWCPGSDVKPEEVLLDIGPGQHTFTFSIPEAQPIDGDKLNHWLISAYLVWEE